MIRILKGLILAGWLGAWGGGPAKESCVKGTLFAPLCGIPAMEQVEQASPATAALLSDIWRATRCDRQPTPEQFQAFVRGMLDNSGQPDRRLKMLVRLKAGNKEARKRLAALLHAGRFLSCGDTASYYSFVLAAPGLIHDAQKD